MEFCSKCGGMLLPEKVKGKVKLRCQACGRIEDLRGKTKSYKITEGGKRVEEVPVVEVKKRKKERVEVIELEPIEYYEELFE
jgi:DNA-directed RNA polymerase subunit M/transcription elongation factor TFIIS